MVTKNGGAGGGHPGQEASQTSAKKSNKVTPLSNSGLSCSTYKHVFLCYRLLLLSFNSLLLNKKRDKLSLETKQFAHNSGVQI